jgi:hypothetical protein
MMFAIMGEDKSDTQSLIELIKRIDKEKHPHKVKKKLAFKPKPYGGWPHLYSKCERDLRQMARRGCDRIIVCIDADGPQQKAEKRRSELKSKIKASGITLKSCIIIPIQMLEAWILADIKAVTALWKDWKPKPITNPEAIVGPKKHLAWLSRDHTKKPRYNDTVHNKELVKHLDLGVLRTQCASFKGLYDFV